MKQLAQLSLARQFMIRGDVPKRMTVEIKALLANTAALA